MFPKFLFFFHADYTVLLLRLHKVTTTSLLIQLKIQCGKLKYDVPPNCWNWCEHLLCQHNKLFCSSVFPFQLLFVSFPSGTRDQLSLHRTLWVPHPSVSLSMASSLLYKINKWKSKFMLVFFSFHSPFFFLSSAGSAFGQRRVSWLLPSSYYASELEEPSRSERNLSIAIILHLIFCKYRIIFLAE